MNIEQVWSATEYEEDPLTEILLANQSKPVEARIRHKVPVTLGLSCIITWEKDGDRNGTELRQTGFRASFRKWE
jgi:hypothetical protein